MPSVPGSASVEASISNNGYGGDFVLNASADLLLVFDVPGNPAATTERLYRLIQTCARQLDENGVAYNDPDDLLNPDWGAGFPRLVGQNASPARLAQVRASVLAAVRGDPAIAVNPPPDFAVVVQGAALVGTLKAWTVSGDALQLTTPLGG